MNQLMDFDRACIDTLLGGVELIRLMTLTLFLMSRGHFETVCVRYLLNWRIDFDQTCIDTSFGEWKGFIRFW